MCDLTILHTNDFHGKLTERGADIIAEAKSGCENCLLLDCGDAISSGNIYYRPGGEPILSRMSELGYDAMAMGNREFHFLERGLKSKVSLARFPILCANLRSRDGEIGPTVKPSILISVGDVKVAVFGVTVPMITRKMLASKFSPYWFEDPLDVVPGVVAELREHSDYVIGLTHIGLQKDQELAAAVPGIDLIVGGHTHAILEQPIFVGATAIVQAGWWGHYLGKAELTGHKVSSGCLIDLRE